MRNVFSAFINDDLWLIQEHNWAKPLQGIRETQFALGNGYLGTRAVLEELPYDAMPGTYISGVYDKMGAQVDELVNLPNPINFRFAVDGEKVGLVAMDCLEHKRILNMKKALLLRHSLYRDSKKRRYNYHSLRFLSAHSKNIGVMQITFTNLDAPCTVDIDTGIDTAVFNSGVLSEGRKKHFRVAELGQDKNAGFLIIETVEKKYTVAYWSGFYYEVDGKKIFGRDNIFSLKLKKNQTVVFTKVFCIKHFPRGVNRDKCKQAAFKIFHRAFHEKFPALLKKHISSWKKLWGKADILIEGTANLQQNLRFNIYHMLSCVHFDNGFSSIGARALSGEGYHGHIFWDAEIFLMPFYLFNFPLTAKNMLLYRYRRIHKARLLAKTDGFQGAKFPWESADSGDEETPEWARDIDKSIIKIYTHKMEHHITSDVAYAAYRYFLATGDEKFMQDCGYEMLFETARFWTSRVEYDKKNRKYEIKRVIGPDEFHLKVNNNAYTNVLAKWNLLTAKKTFDRLRRLPGLYRRLKDRLHLSEKEAKTWVEIASKIKISVRQDKVIEQFDGYFKLKNIPLTRTDENGIPFLPDALKASELKNTQLVKQADVLMLFALLNDVFSPSTKAANYDYYIPRTTHKSSLSPSMHALVASETGDLNRAYNLFNVSLRTDISNLFGNTHEGIHAASLGGTWQAVIFGFAGVRIIKEHLFINPRMPRTWKKMVFSLLWKDILLKLQFTNNTIQLKTLSRKAGSLQLGIFEKLTCVRTNSMLVFKRQLPGQTKEFLHY